MIRTILLTTVCLCGASFCRADATNLVSNGSFEESRLQPGVPEDWALAGNPALRQQLRLDAGREGGRCVQLECTEFAGDGPDFHAMLCQVGKVGVHRGRWYRLSFWARAEGIKAGSVEVALVNTRGWENSGLSESFTPGPEWKPFDLMFQARNEVPPETSRLQFWFKSTGSLWLDDVALTESSEGAQWFPQRATEGVKNAVPNSSFECGAAGWGSLTFGLDGWGGNLYRLEASLDGRDAHHGGHSLKISLDARTLPEFWFDYYEPVRQPVRRVLVANQGWFRVRPGEALTLSAYLRADVEGAVAQMAATEAPNHLLRKEVRVGTRWDRYEFTFTPSEAFLFIAVGLDLEASKRDAATLWVDAVQLERGTRATDYAPRSPVESAIETGVPGNIFTDVRAGASFSVRAYNDSDREQSLRGKLAVSDFFDQTVFETVETLKLPPHAGASRTLGELCKGKLGAFRATWTPAEADEASEQRLAIITPVEPGAADSPFGFNHAYPWDFLVRLARQAGIVWWRDWSAKWQTIEPERGRRDFSIPDAQIERVLDQDCAVEVLLPFPSTTWSTSARTEDVASAAGRDRYLRSRLPLAYAPKDRDDFGRYAAAVVRHYQQTRPRAVTHYQVLNEPVYTNYALPRQFGYTLDDYLGLLETAWGAMKEVDPACRVVGGISANLVSTHTRDFVTKGGLRHVDVFDLHMYDAPRPAENYEEPFRALEELMRAHGGPRPVWITEWGCYADDDPPCLPHSVGDPTMNRCRWPSERAATEHLVKFAAVSFAHGVRKVFFHAGTCGRINGPDAGGVLFEYGGTPRKMYAGVAALTRLLGVPDECVRILDRDGLHAYAFRVRDRTVAVAWCEPGRTRRVARGDGCQAYDIMGNPLPGPDVALDVSPIYLVGPTADSVLAPLHTLNH
jgi:hypothetical protein